MLLDDALNKKEISHQVYAHFKQTYEAYLAASEGYISPREREEIFLTLLNFVKQDAKTPFVFQPYHQQLRSPVDYYALSNRFFLPLIDFNKSQFLYQDRLDTIQHQLQNNHNIILLANHQTESDSQLLRLSAMQSHPELAEKIISVAGDRVTKDPMARPFSIGCNLICIYSKRHIEFPPEEKTQKLHHNHISIRKLKTLLNQGGQIIYVAPSGGRDRKTADQVLLPAAFQAESIELFRLIALTAKQPTHCYPMALKTYNLLPPPSEIQTHIGEQRLLSRCPIFFALGEEIVWDTLPTPSSHPELDKITLRNLRADAIYKKVLHLYQKIADL